MKKITFQNSQGRTLAGVIHTPKLKTDSAIIISHGSMATKDRPKFIALAEALEKEGFVVLRFDFGGCGESEFSELTLKNEIEDLRAAINYIRDRGKTNIGLVGDSLGGLISILSYDDNITTMVLVAPVTTSKTPSLIQNEELHQQLNDKGVIIHKKRDGSVHTIPKEYLEERLSINQQVILSKIKCPVLIIHGDSDNTVPLSGSIKAMDYLMKMSKLEIIKGGDHQFNEKIDIVIPHIIQWFKKYL